MAESKENMKFEAREGATIEVAFSFDTTGSMKAALKEVRQNLKEITRKLTDEIPKIRIALIAHGDYCDCIGPYVIKILDFTRDIDELQNFADSTPSTGGGDAPECYELVLREATSLSWSDDSAKALVVIGDSHPHPPSMTDQKIYWRKEMEKLKSKGVKIYGVCVRVSDRKKAFYECLAKVTGGAFIEFQDFSLITQMFLAVCYRSTSENRYAAFKRKLQEKKATETMTDEAKEDLEKMIGKLDEVSPTTDSTTDSIREARDDAHKPVETYENDYDEWNLSEAWWNPGKYDDLSKTPEYCYDVRTKGWSKNSEASSSAEIPSTSRRTLTSHAYELGRGSDDSGAKCILQ